MSRTVKDDDVESKKSASRKDSPSLVISIGASDPKCLISKPLFQPAPFVREESQRIIEASLVHQNVRLVQAEMTARMSRIHSIG